MNEETKPTPSSPARAIESTPRFQRVVELAKRVGISITWQVWLPRWIVETPWETRTCATIDELESAVVEAAEVIHKHGIAAGEALAKWRGGR